jgi:hypothetical protein
VAGDGQGPTAVEEGIVIGTDDWLASVAAGFIEGIARLRHWEREPKGGVAPVPWSLIL